MQRARRAAAVAVVALTGGLMLSGCQSQPSVAAYVGNTRITVDQVNQLVDEVDAASRQRNRVVQYGDARQFVLGRLVLLEVAKRYVDEHGISAPAVDIDGTAQNNDLPASLRFVSLLAQSSAYVNLVAARSSPNQPTDGDLHDIFDRLPHAGVTFDQAKAQIQNLQGLPEALGARNYLQKIVSQFHVVINPQYRGTEVGILAEPVSSDGSSVTIVSLTLGDSTNAGDGFVSS